MTTFRAAAVLVTITVLMGSMVAATESGAACPTWPGCYPGQFGPKLHLNPVVEFTHRVIAGVGLLTCLAGGFLAVRDPGVERAVKPLPFVAFAGGVASALFGALTVLTGIGKGVAVIDLTAALVAMTATIVAAVRVGHPGSGWRWDRTTKAATAMYLLLLVIHQLGIVVAAPNSFTRVISWPVWRLVPGDLWPSLQRLRLLLLVAAIAAAGYAVASAWRRLRLPAAGVAVCVVAELATGLVVLSTGLPMGLAALYSGLAGATLAATAYLAARSTVDTTGAEAAPALDAPAAASV